MVEKSNQVTKTADEYQLLLEQKEVEIAALKNTNDDLRDAYEKLVSRTAHFVRAIEQGPVSVIITNAKGVIEFVNSKFEEVSGYSADEVIGKSTSMLKSGETPSDTYNQLWTTLETEKEWTGIFHNRKKSGELFWERAVISGVSDKDGNISHYVAVEEDITHQREMEEKLEQEQHKYFHQSKMAEIGILASGILHEVSNPIASIRGLVTEIKEAIDLNPSHLDKLASSNLNMILEQTDRLMGITHEISDFTSPNTEEVELLDINGIIRSVCRLVQFDKRWHHINLTLDLDSQLPALSGHKDQLSHLLINVLINAADAVEETGNETRLIGVKTLSSGQNLSIAISDNGAGMSQEIQAHAFETFFTTKKPGKGTGLGLSLCKSIVDSHNGSVEIESSQGKGTTVRIILPVNFDYSI